MLLSRQQFEALKRETFLLATQVGLHAAADAMGLSKTRVRKWASKDKWQISLIRPNANRAELSRSFTPAREALAKVMGEFEDRSRIAMAKSGMRAFEQDFANGLSWQELGERHEKFLMDWDYPAVMKGMQMLQEAQMGPWKSTPQ